MQKQNKDGMKFEDEVGEIIKNVFCDDNIKEISNTQYEVLCDEGRDEVLNNVFDDHRDFKAELAYKSYLVHHPFFNKVHDAEGEADWAYYSLAHSDGIMIESFSHNVGGSKDGRISEDVLNLFISFSQRHRILVIGGERRHLLTQRANCIFNKLKPLFDSNVDVSTKHIVVVEDLYSLLKSLEIDESVEIVLEEDAVINAEIDSNMVANG